MFDELFTILILPEILIFHCALASALIAFVITQQKSFKIIHYFAFILLTFSLCGYMSQLILYLHQGQLLNLYWATGINAVSALILVSCFYLYIYYLRNQKNTINKHLLGYIAIIHGSKAKVNETSIAYLRDEYGYEHYIPIEAEMGEIAPNTPVLLVRLNHGRYVARDIKMIIHQPNE